MATPILLGTLGGTLSIAQGVSTDGLVVVGVSRNSSGTDRAFRWTATGGMVDLGTLGGFTATAFAASANGSVVVGISRLADSTQRSFRWTQGGGMVSLGTLGGPNEGGAQDVSADGSVVVGTSNVVPNYNRAYRWTQAGGMVSLGTLGTGLVSYAEGVSSDGSVVVGYADPTPSAAMQAWRWTQAGGMVAIPTPAGMEACYARAVSADGNTVLLECYPSSGAARPYLWTAAGGAVSIGGLGTAADSSYPDDLSADGSTVVGRSNMDPGTGMAAFPWRWTAGSGVQPLGFSPGGTSGDATGVSGNGFVVVGVVNNTAARWSLVSSALGSTPAIVFEVLTAGPPDTTGDGSARLRKPGAFGLQAAGDYGIARIRRVSASGSGGASLAGAGIARLPRMSAYGSNAEITTIVAQYVGYGSAHLSRMSARGYDTGVLVPNSGHSDFTLPMLKVSSIAAVRQVGSGTARLPHLRTIGFQTGGNWGVARIHPLTVYGAQVLALPTTYFSVMEPAPYVRIFSANIFYSVVHEDIVLDTHMSATQSVTIRERVVVKAKSLSRAQVLAALSNHVVFAEALHQAYTDLITEEADFTVGVLPSTTAIARIIDKLLLTNVVKTQLHAQVALAAAVVLGATVTPAWVSSLVENVELLDELAAMMLQIGRATEHIDFDDNVVGSMRFVVQLSEKVTSDDDVSMRGLFHDRLDEGLVLDAYLALGNEQYRVWVMSPDNEAIYQYEGYNFNSFTQFKGRYYGANGKGLFLLEGDDDAGVPIAARIRTGLMDFGTGRLKQMARAYLGYTAAGTLLLKTVTVLDRGPDRGKKLEDWYELGRVRADMGGGRIPIGEGIKSVYWQFVLHNKAGADFEVDEIKLYPLITDRRINRG